MTERAQRPSSSGFERAPDVRVPMLDLTPHNGPLLPAIRDALDRLFAKNAFVLGEEVTNFEREIAASLGVKP